MRHPISSFTTAAIRPIRTIACTIVLTLLATLLPALSARADETDTWEGTVSISVSRATVDVHDRHVTVTATASEAIESPYYLGIFDGQGQKVAECSDWADDYWGISECADGVTVSGVHQVPDNESRTYTAYVSQDPAPRGGVPEYIIAAQAASPEVRNTGWNGSVQLSVEDSPFDQYVRLRAEASAPIRLPYTLAIYDDLGNMYASCYNDFGSWQACGNGGVSLTRDVVPEHHVGRTFTAYVSQEQRPPSYPTNLTLPKLDVRATSAGISTQAAGPTTPGETHGGSNPSVACSQRCHGDPVNSVTGEFWESNTDLQIGGVGLPLAVDRSYATARRTVDGSFGLGSSSTIDMRIVTGPGVPGAIATAATVQVVQENGSTIPFTRAADGTYAAPARVKADLERTSTGEWVLSRRDGDVFTFDAAGRLTSRNGTSGPATTYERDDQGRVTSMTKGASSIALTRTTDGHVATATDHTGSSVTYTYSGAGELTTVALPDGGAKTYTYDQLHRVVAMEHPGGGTTTNVFDSANRVTSQTDPIGRELTFAYGPAQTTITNSDGSVTIERHVDGQVTSETHAAGTDLEATTTFTYDVTNQVATQTSPTGKVTAHTYDGAGNRTSTTDPLGRTSTMMYDEVGNLLTETNAAGETTTYTYDAGRNVLTETTPSGATTTFAYNADGTMASRTSPTGETATVSYDSNGRPAAVTAPDGSTTWTTHDAAGNLVTSTDPRGSGSGDPGFTTTFTHDAAGRVTSQTDPLGATSTVTYDHAGRPTATTDPLGATTTLTYDAAGQLTTVTDALGNAVQVTYDGAGRATNITDAIGGSTLVAFDTLGRPTSTTDAIGRTSRTVLDADGNLVQEVTPSGAITAHAYDDAGQLTQTTDARGGVSTTAYDDAGRVVSATDEQGRTVTATYTPDGQVATIVRGDDSELAWTYDASGRVIEYTGADGATITSTYDVNGRVATQTDLAGRVTGFSYDAAGNVITKTLPDDSVITYTYDSAGRRTAIAYSDNTPDVTFTYDAGGNLTGTDDGTGHTEYTRDELGRLTAEASAEGTVGYAWDAAGNLSALTYPGGETVEREHDGAGQLVSITDWAGSVYGLEWSADGALTSTSYPNGVTTAAEQDATGQTTSLSTTSAGGTELLALAYEYSGDGLVTSQDTTRSSGTSASTYAWDNLQRLDQVDGHGAGQVTYDDGGRVTGLPDGRALTYDASGQVESLTRPQGTTSYAYDARGNRATATAPGATAAHTYDLENRLTALDQGAGTTYAYTYSADGLRRSASVTTGDQATTETFAWNTVEGVPLLLEDGAHAFIYGATGTPLAQLDKTTGGATYLHTDTLGSVRTTTDAAGEVTSELDFDPYGLRTSQGEPATRFGFAGEYTDPTGYTYLRARYYDPQTAQFITRDPIEVQTAQAYDYTAGNPLQYVDPLGLFSLDPRKWDAGILDTVSGITGGVAAVLVVTGVGAPAAAVLGGISTGTAVIATHNRVQQGDSALDVVLSAAGALPAVGSLAAKVAARGSIRAASSASRAATASLTRASSLTSRASGTPLHAAGRAGYGLADRFDVSGVLIYTPMQFLSGTRALWCGGVI